MGDAIRAYLGDQTTAHVQVWPIWEQNIIICSTTVLPQAQQLLGDFQLLVGDQQLPVRGHAKTVAAVDLYTSGVGDSTLRKVISWCKKCYR